MATSTTSTPSATPSLWRLVTASLSMTEQNGQATAMVLAPVAMASSPRFLLTCVPIFSYIHMRAPPAPQQKDLSAVRPISTLVAPVASMRSRGGR